MLFLKFQTLNICIFFSKMRCKPSVRLGIAYEQSRRMVKYQNSPPYFPLKSNLSKQMLQHFLTDTLKFMGLKTPFIYHQKEYQNTRFTAVMKFKAFWGLLLRDTKHYYSLTNLQTYAIALNYFYFKWPEQVSICLLKWMFLIQPPFFFVRQFCTTPQRKTYQDTVPLHLTNGNVMFSKVYRSSTF